MADSAHDSSTPSLLAKHLPLLISTSQAFCNRLVEDPSAWGVSAAFVTVESVFEQVFVDYCRVVGQIMLACQEQSPGQKTPPSPHSRFPSTSKRRRSIANGANEFGRISSSKSADKVAMDDREKSHQASGSHGVDEISLNGSASHAVPRSQSVPGKSKLRRISMPNSSAPSITPVSIPSQAASDIPAQLG